MQSKNSCESIAGSSHTTDSNIGGPKMNKKKLSVLTLGNIKPVTDKEVQSPRQQMGAIFLDQPEEKNGISSSSNSSAPHNHGRSVTPDLRKDIRISLPQQVPIVAEEQEEEVEVPNLITQVVRQDSPYKQNLEEARQRIILYKKNSVPASPKSPEPIPKKSFFSMFRCCIPSRSMPVKIEQQILSSSDENFLPPVAMDDANKKLLLLDLDETLPVDDCDFEVNVEIEQAIHTVYVLVRPHVHEFLVQAAKFYEIGIFTASLSKYANPVLDKLDTTHVVKHRLFREHCVQYKGNFVKDLGMLGRPLKDMIIIDNSPSCYLFHKNNAVAITSWFDDMEDQELLDMLPFLEELSNVDNVQNVLDASF